MKFAIKKYYGGDPVAKAIVRVDSANYENMEPFVDAVRSVFPDAEGLRVNADLQIVANVRGSNPLDSYIMGWLEPVVDDTRLFDGRDYPYRVDFPYRRLT